MKSGASTPKYVQDIESDFYLNLSLNNNLESEFKKNIGDALVIWLASV
jgi:hypothetical protein